MRSIAVALTLGSGIVLGLVTVPRSIAAPVAALNVLTRVEPGRWELKPYDGQGVIRRLCIADAASLLQLEHPGAACSRYVIDNQPGTATVHYTCPGAGHGRTTIRVESGQLLDIQSQGIADKAPFDSRWEARRLGPCQSARR